MSERSDRASTGRRPVGRPRLPVTRIVDTALELVDEQGAEALSMRALAQRLGSGTATLYRHFDNRDTLVSAVADRLLSELTLDEVALRDATWQDALVIMARSAFTVLRAHPRAAPLFAEIPRGPNGMRLREAGLSILLANDFAPDLAVRVWATFSRFILGFASQLPTGERGTDDEDAGRAGRADSDLLAAYPAVRAVVQIGSISLQDEFDFGLELLVAGLVATHRTG